MTAISADEMDVLRTKLSRTEKSLVDEKHANTTLREQLAKSSQMLSNALDQVSALQQDLRDTAETVADSADERNMLWGEVKVLTDTIRVLKDELLQKEMEMSNLQVRDLETLPSVGRNGPENRATTS